ncbi:MAG: hypothetical protein J6Q50_04995 [Clostridia bacterium]|nr:hypothetical protein [Clostridia bacterium]
MSIYNHKKNKIGFFTELYLSYRGKKDARTKSVRTGKDGSLESPFIRKEISLCSAAIEEQKIALIERLLEEHIKNEAFKASVNKHYVALRMIRENGLDFEYDISAQQTNNSNDTVDKLLKHHEMMSNKFAQNIRTHLIEIEGCNVESDIAKNDLNINKEYETTYVKCLKYVDILFARLSAYWSGVLKCDYDGAKFPTYFAYEEIKSELIAKLNEVKNIKLNDIKSVSLNNEM